VKRAQFATRFILGEHPLSVHCPTYRVKVLDVGIDLPRPFHEDVMVYHHAELALAGRLTVVGYHPEMASGRHENFSGYTLPVTSNLIRLW
jgi:hypothetical protein